MKINADSMKSRIANYQSHECKVFFYLVFTALLVAMVVVVMSTHSVDVH